MKKYIKPTTEIVVIESQAIICTSPTGVEGTANMSSSIGEGTTDEALSNENTLDIWN